MTTVPTTIRKAVPEDIDEIQAFITHCVNEGYVLPRTLRELENLLPMFFVAINESGKMVGCVTLEIYSWKLAEIRSLCVLPELRGKGVGKRLVDACIALAKEKKVLEVMAITHNENFFINCGFDYTLPNQRKAVFYRTRENIFDALEQTESTPAKPDDNDAS